MIEAHEWMQASSPLFDRIEAAAHDVVHREGRAFARQRLWAWCRLAELHRFAWSLGCRVRLR